MEWPLERCMAQSLTCLTDCSRLNGCSRLTGDCFWRSYTSLIISRMFMWRLAFDLPDWLLPIDQLPFPLFLRLPFPLSAPASDAILVPLLSEVE
jgi:hypothetical protein